MGRSSELFIKEREIQAEKERYRSDKLNHINNLKEEEQWQQKPKNQK